MTSDKGLTHSFLKMANKQDLAIVIPAYNAEKTIGNLIFKLKKSMSYASIIVVNDGSRDQTQRASASEGIFYIEHPKNFGKGVALNSGFEKALNLGAKYIVSIDSDGQHDVNDIHLLIEKIRQDDLDLVIGSRMADVSTMPMLRLLSNRITSKLISWRIKQNIEDSQCGLRVHNADMLRNLCLQRTGFDFETELLLKASLSGFKIGFTHIRTIYPDKNTSFIRIKDAFNFILVYVLSFFWKRRKT